MKRIFDRIVALFGSFGLAVVTLLLLFVLTGFGTWEQHYRSIYDVQQDYFESLFVVPSFFPLPLPGAYLLLAVLCLNLIVGGLIRIRKRLATLGVIIAHVGIVTLLLGGMIEFQLSTKGSVTLYPGDVKRDFESYFDWDVTITEYLDDEHGRAYVIPHGQFLGLDGGEQALFTSAALPFQVTLSGYTRNARPLRAPDGRGVDGFLLRAVEPANPSEQNLPGLTIALSGTDKLTPRRGLLWGAAEGPLLVDADGRRFGITLERRTWPMPFELGLERFVKSEHPGTSMAKEYSSYVQKFEGGVVQDIHITMNEPLRDRGFTFYQASFIENRLTGRTATVLAVVENPADQVPGVAVWVIFAGLLIHFGIKLRRHIQSEERRRRNATA